RRAIATVLAVLGTAAGAGAARAQSVPDEVAIRDVRVHGAGFHQVRLSVVDRLGRPVEGLGAHDLDVQLDNRPVDDLELRPATASDAGLETLVLPAPDLAARLGRSGVKDLLERLAEGAGSKDRFELAVPGAARGARVPAARVDELAESLPERDSAPRAF